MSEAVPPTASQSFADPAIPRGEDALYREFEASRAPGKICRIYLDTIRDEVAAHHFAGASGIEVVRAATSG